jgi:hypothetical protein
VTTSTNGSNWTHSPQVTGQSSALAPALTVFNNQLVLAYVANNSSHDLLVTTSTNGISWTSSAQLSGQSSALAPAMAAIPNPTYSQTPFTSFNLMIVYVANNGSNDLLVTTSADGLNWTKSKKVTGQSSRQTSALGVTEGWNTE